MKFHWYVLAGPGRARTSGNDTVTRVGTAHRCRSRVKFYRYVPMGLGRAQTSGDDAVAQVGAALPFVDGDTTVHQVHRVHQAVPRTSGNRRGPRRRELLDQGVETSAKDRRHSPPWTHRPATAANFDWLPPRRSQRREVEREDGSAANMGETWLARPRVVASRQRALQCRRACFGGGA